MIICTAYNPAFAQVGELCAKSIQDHCRRTGHAWTIRIIPEGYDCQPSWFKVGLIAELLQQHERVLWIDADSLLIDPGDIAEALPPPDSEKPLCITFDENGANGGVMAWTQCRLSELLLQRIAELHDIYKDGIWFEQHAIHHLMQECPVGKEWWSEVPKRVFNAYTNELCPETRVLHLAGFEISDKLLLMQAQIIAMNRNGHGLKK